MLYPVTMSLAAGRRAIPLYLLVTWTFSSLFYFLIIKSAGTNAASGAYTTGLMWCPAIGALLTCEYLRRPIASLGEFGIGFTLVAAVLAAYFWRRRAEVAQPRL